MQSFRIAGLIYVLAPSGCYAPQTIDTTTGNDSSAGSESSTVSTTVTTAPTESSSDPSMTSSPSTTVDPDSTTATTELGPQIVMSVPADGDPNAPLDQFFMLYFDRVVGIDDAVGNIHVAQDGGDPVPISPMPCPPDADPTCVAGLFPSDFLVDDQHLPPNTAHSIVVGPGFADPDGNMNTMDQVVSFTTFDYDPLFFDDSDAFSNEFGGLAYDAASSALYLVGEQAGGGGCVVRAVRLVDGAPQIAETVAQPTGSSLCYGVDAFNGELWVSGSYSSNVYRYDLSSVPITQIELIAMPPLPAPFDNLDEVWSTTLVGTDGVLFAHGEFVGGIEHSSILARQGGSWSEWRSGSPWPEASGVVVASGASGDPVYVLAQQQLFRLQTDAMVADEHTPEFLSFDDDLQVDSAGRVWVGTYGGVYALDGLTFEVLAQRTGFAASRIALREDGDTVHVYFARFRDSAEVGHVAIDF